MVVDEMELETWLREAGVPQTERTDRKFNKKHARWPFNRIPARGEVYAVHMVRPRLKLISAEHLLHREEVPA